MDDAVGAGAEDLPRQARAGSGVSGVLNASAMAAPAVSLALADGRTVTAQLQRVARDERRGTRSWVGTFADSPGGSLVLTEVRGTVSGFASYQGETLEIVPRKNGRHVLFAVDPAKVPDLDGVMHSAIAAGDVATTPATTAANTGGAPGTPVVQDLLVVYTAAASAAWGQATLEGMIESAVQSANQAYLNSQAAVALNVVGVQQVALAESGSGMQATLGALEQDAEVRALRDALAADMVVLVSQDSDWCGYAHLTITSTSTTINGVTTNTSDAEAYAVAHSDCLSNSTLAHEVGHLQGLDHNREDATGGGLYPYSFGYRACVAGGFLDIMSYPCPATSEPRILQFSNPSLYDNGYGTGIGYELDPAHAADAARSLNDSASMVAAYRVAAPALAAPAAPSNLAASGVTYDSVALGWTDNATNESGYTVERSVDGLTFQEVASLGGDATSFPDVSVLPATSYAYRVRAFNSAGTSAYSATVSVTTPDAPPPPPPAPAGVSAANQGNGTALIAWATGTTNATSFQVQRETWNARKKTWERSTIVATVAAGTLSIVDASNNGTFRYFVRAQNSGGSSGYAGPAQVTVSGAATTTRGKTRN